MQAKYPGLTIKIGDEEFIIPPLSLGQLRNGALSKMKEHDELIAQGRAYDSMVLRGEIILAALHRNYPDFEPEKLYTWLDVGNIGPIWLAVLGLSGFTSGEVRAATVTENGTSKGSTEALPPLMDGLTAK